MKKWINLLIYFIGFILYCSITLLVKTNQRFIFLIVAIYFLYNIMIILSFISKDNKEMIIKKNQNKAIIGKYSKKLSY